MQDCLNCNMDSLLKEMTAIDDRFKGILATWAAEAERCERLQRKWVRQVSALNRSSAFRRSFSVGVNPHQK